MNDKPTSLRDRAAQLVNWDLYPRRSWLIVNREELEEWHDWARRDFERIVETDCVEMARFEVPFPFGVKDLDVIVFRRDP